MSIEVSARILPAVAGPTPERIALLAELDLPVFGHILTEGWVSGLHRVCGGARVAGRVVTISIDGTDSSLVHYATSLVAAGDVVVIDMPPGSPMAPVGGIMAESFARSGVAAVVVDGFVTDIDELRHSGLAVYARGLAAVTTRWGAAPLGGGINVPVRLGGVDVRPGMVALGDENGLLIAEASALDVHVDAVRSMMADDPEITRRLRAGEQFVDFFFPAERREALRAAETSRTERC